MKNSTSITISIVAIIVSVIFIYSCKSGTEPEKLKPELVLITSHPLQINQPSGIAYNKDFSGCWIVDGDNERIYKTDLNGNIINRLSFKGNDIEGIYFDGVSSLWIVEEELREVINIDLDGMELSRHKINVTGTVNNGFEGITFDESGRVFVLNEKNPNALYSLNEKFEVVKEFDLDFATDASDICYNFKSDSFYILSDESKAVFLWNVNEKLNYKLDLPFTKFEGITVNPNNNKILMVNDSLNTMYEYELIMK